MDIRQSTVILRLCASEGEKVGLEDAGKLLIALQEMAWHMGSYLEGQPFSEAGRLKKQILDDYGLLIKSISSGSVVVEIESAVKCGQPEIDNFQKYQPPGPRVITKITDFIAAVLGEEGRELDDVVPDPAYRSRLLLDMFNLYPRKPNYALRFEGQGGRSFEMSAANRCQIEGLISERQRHLGQEVRIGLLADLRVDPEKVMKIERIGEKLKAIYSSDFEASARDLLGHPIKVTGRAERISGSPKIKNFFVDQIEPYESYQMEEFEVGDRTFISLNPIEVSVEFDEGLWTLSIPYIDAVGYSTDYYEAENLLHDFIDELWTEYVLCPEDDLGKTGKLLREMLLGLFKVN
jgi:hypothetical protein